MCAMTRRPLRHSALLSRLEGILPALESSHALGYLVAHKDQFAGKKVVLCLSGRGDKDMDIVKTGGIHHG